MGCAKLQTSVHIRTATLSRGLVLVGTCAHDPGPQEECYSGASNIFHRDLKYFKIIPMYHEQFLGSESQGRPEPGTC